ncbi:hypothetical protein B0T24DRAFT_256241 [Lasiosphaeria ovina]|uniref:Uncharacterized protein n=1 Tax=Lasiosphaeria ovina TaxID=92902 RepID=A0AAE0KBU9_9PEZI|nr:hypothetical protein B0T24DRAFT_256241 [Lasiosphaeria ovina]
MEQGQEQTARPALADRLSTAQAGKGAATVQTLMRDKAHASSQLAPAISSKVRPVSSQMKWVRVSVRYLPTYVLADLSAVPWLSACWLRDRDSGQKEVRWEVGRMLSLVARCPSDYPDGLPHDTDGEPPQQIIDPERLAHPQPIALDLAADAGDHAILRHRPSASRHDGVAGYGPCVMLLLLVVVLRLRCEWRRASHVSSPPAGRGGEPHRHGCCNGAVKQRHRSRLPPIRKCPQLPGRDLRDLRWRINEQQLSPHPVNANGRTTLCRKGTKGNLQVPSTPAISSTLNGFHC